MAGYITGDLVSDLWWFIENVTDDDPTRNDQFFALRERVRERKDKTLPDGDYTLSDEGAWFTLRNLSIRILAQDQQGVVSIYRLGEEEDESIDSAYAYFDEGGLKHDNT